MLFSEHGCNLVYFIWKTMVARVCEWIHSISEISLKSASQPQEGKCRPELKMLFWYFVAWGESLGKRLAKSYPLVMTNIAMERSTILMGKSTISMAIFNSYVSHYQRVPCLANALWMKDEGRSFTQGTERGPLYGSSALPFRGIERPLCPGDHTTMIIPGWEMLGNYLWHFMTRYGILWLRFMWNIDISCSAIAALLDL